MEQTQSEILWKLRNGMGKVWATAKTFFGLGASMALSLGACIAPSRTARAAEHRAAPAPQITDGWLSYGGHASQDHYSSLSQINRNNVKNLKVAWTFDTGETGSLETTPVIVSGVLYAYTPSLTVVALDAASGKLLWTFDSGVHEPDASRGVSYWTDGKESRLFAGMRNLLYALDPATGKPIKSFGEGGYIDLRRELRGDYTLQSIGLTSPGVIYKDLIIVGGRDPETPPAPPGDIRAFDVHTGALRWRFHAIPHPGEVGYDTWPKDAWTTAGAANNWAGMALDEQRGIVYAPTGSAIFDFYGGNRVGNDLFANSMLALDAETGKLRWYFQGVHHDLWDRDFPSPPALVTVQRNGKSIDAVAQTTKQGWVFVFDRTNGQSLFPIEERQVPRSTVPGEVTSPTQPVPLLPAPYTRQVVTEDTLTDRTPQAHAAAVEQFRTFAGGTQFVPGVLGKATIVFPGVGGGAEWGGSAVDPNAGILYINANQVAFTTTLVKNDRSAGIGLQTYRSQCAVCHGVDRSGAPPAYPSLVDVYNRLTAAQITGTIHQGRGRMSSFPNLQGMELDALLEYLRTGRDTGKSSAVASDAGPPASGSANRASLEQAAAMMPYSITGYTRFDDAEGYPAVAPPWGTLNAIDLNTGKYLWKVPLGEYPELAAKGLKNTGTENYGGPIVTAGGLLIIAATDFDHKIRAFNSRTGELLWEALLPFSGVATPATYMVDGKQYIVIAACGARDPKSPPGAVYVAFALP
jgi:quinoprotein glucose dehydrogenase